MSEGNDSSDQAQRWVWALVSPGTEGDDIIAVTDVETEEVYVPVFDSKEDGLTGQANLPNPDGRHRELQAVPLADLLAMAQEKGAQIILLDEDGKPAKLL